MRPLHDSLPTRLTVVAVLLVLLPLAGCATRKKDVVVTGKVTYKGNPVPGGTIAFYTSDTQTPVAKTQINADGTYRVTGLPAGTLQVAVETDSARKNTGAPPGASEAAKEYAAKNSNQQKYVAIPPKYRDHNASGLTYSGEPTKDFNLTD